MSTSQPLNSSDISSQLVRNWQNVCQKIEIATNNVHRNQGSSKLIAVSKTKPAEMITTLVKQGQQDFGENYLQEAIDKITYLKESLPDTPITWHYIGSIQRNKTRDISEHFDWVHTVERDIIAKRLNDQRPDTLSKLNVLIQVNIDHEDSKSGCLPDELDTLVASIKDYTKLNLRGLMIIPAKSSDDAFQRTQTLFQNIATTHPELTEWDTLSMGMSGDIESAIEHGSTMVRVGTAIFGAR